MNNLKIKYEKICHQYIEKFCEKNELDFEGWVGDIVGSIAYCSDMFLNFQDIVWDINSDQPKRLIVEWYYNSVDNPLKSINYYSYTKGFRV
jgi:hypothetical protein